MQPEVPIQVAIRVRPLIGDEIHTNPDPCLYCIPDQPQLIIGKDRNFSFDYIFPENSNQTLVYEDCVKPLISTFFEGYNATVFAYGQTGSGKTYTMGTGNCVYFDEEERGIVPRAVTDLFETMAEIEEKVVCKIRVSFIEVYREETTDLLETSTKNLQIRDDEAGNTVVVGAHEEPADTVEDVLHLLDAGTAMRHVGSTNMNDVSSRSHCIFTLTLDQYPLSEMPGVKGNVLSSRFHFVDLAGSERAHRTGNQGARFKESVYINTGLLALGNVISALSDPKRKTQHIPYRESKLTRLLKDSLGGNSRTVMITCLSPALADLDENITSLKYATRAKNIKNKPVVNWDIESSKISRMETEIQALRGQIQRKTLDQSDFHRIDMERINNLEIENEKQGTEQHHYLQSLHEVNVLLQAVESTGNIPLSLKENIENWRHKWEKNQFDRPMTAPPKRSALRRPQNDVLENMRNELSKYKEQMLADNELLEERMNDMEELRQEIIVFGEENAQLRLELDIAINNAGELHERLFEQQLLIQQIRRSAASSRQPFLDERPAASILKPITSQDRVMLSFRAKNEMLMSQMDDLDAVERDEDISSDEEGKEVIRNCWVAKQHTEPTMSRGRCFMSQIPRPTKVTHNGGMKQSRPVPMLTFKRLSIVEHNTLAKLETTRDTARHEARNAEFNVREVTNRLKELQLNIQQKEGLIQDLLHSEHEARVTSCTYQDKLNKLEKEYEKSKRELEEAQQKINQCEKSNNKDSTQKSKLENDFKKKQQLMQKKLNDWKQKETVSDRISSYQVNNEKKVKDLEAWISRMKNQHVDLEGRLKTESEKKSKFEQELRKNELHIKELELKTDQQQKLLKRKNEEVVAAQRKLRNSAGPYQTNEHLEKKKQWIDDEIEKIIARQKHIEILEAELRERDKSLKKKEVLLIEKDHLEVKKTKSGQSLSQSIMHLSVQMENVDEQIQHLSEMQNREKFCKDLSKLQRVKQDLTTQKSMLENTVEFGGLEPAEARRLIELGEAIEAVDEAIQFKNDLISEKQSFLDETELDHYMKAEELLNNMGDFTSEEYKHLLGKLFLKIIELRKYNIEADEVRYHFEIKVSEQEKKVLDMQHMMQVIESRYVRQINERDSSYEKDMRFFMENLRNNIEGETSKDSAIAFKEKVKLLEKELYYYKTRCKKYKEQLRDFTKNVSVDTDDLHESAERNHSGGHKRGIDSEDEFHLPPVKSNNLLMEKRDKLEKRYPLDQQAQEDVKRIQDIFEGKPPSSPVANRSKRGSIRKKYAEEQPYTEILDSIEVTKNH